MKNYLNKSTFKGIKSELTVKYGVGKGAPWKNKDLSVYITREHTGRTGRSSVLAWIFIKVR